MPKYRRAKRQSWMQMKNHIYPMVEHREWYTKWPEFGRQQMSQLTEKVIWWSEFWNDITHVVVGWSIHRYFAVSISFELNELNMSIQWWVEKGNRKWQSPWFAQLEPSCYTAESAAKGDNWLVGQSWNKRAQLLSLWMDWRETTKKTIWQLLAISASVEAIMDFEGNST